MKPRTIADALIAKHGVNAAYTKVRARTRYNLMRSLDNATVHRAIFWMLVGQMVQKVGNARAWT